MTEVAGEWCVCRKTSNAQKIKFSIKYFFSKCEKIYRIFLFFENFIFCVVAHISNTCRVLSSPFHFPQKKGKTSLQLTHFLSNRIKFLTEIWWCYDCRQAKNSTHEYFHFHFSLLSSVKKNAIYLSDTIWYCLEI